VNTQAQPDDRRALAIVLGVLLIDMIGFGIVMPVMPTLITTLTHTTLARRHGCRGG